jgi:hypothetical protein
MKAILGFNCEKTTSGGCEGCYGCQADCDIHSLKIAQMKMIFISIPLRPRLEP